MKLTAKLPEDHGLVAVDRQMVDRPETAVTVVAILDTHKLTTDLDTGTVEPTVRIVSIEPLTTDLDTKAARKLLDAAHARRTGRQLLPMNVDPDTGEVAAS